VFDSAFDMKAPCQIIGVEGVEFMALIKYENAVGLLNVNNFD
jgi:hypothetical protein